MSEKNIITKLNNQKSVEMMKGIFRKTMSYNDDLMLCHFTMKKDSTIPLHNHVAAQNGFVIKGKVRFFTKDNENIVVESGDGYVFDSNEFHGSEVLEGTELIECFSPMRPEYVS